MTDTDILRHISQLVDEEHALVKKHGEEGGLSEDEHQRMRELEVSLDQCWDLLRQRRAKRNAGLNPDDASLRNADIVEHYQQ